MACAVRALAKGNMQGRLAGSPDQMPGMFLIAPDGRVLWQHDFSHIGDHPDFDALVARFPKSADG